jgi:hypothetical protein
MGAEQSRCAAHGVARALCEYRAAAWGRVSASVANGSWRVHSEHAPYLLQGGFGECALLGAKRCAFGIEPHGAFLFWAELLQSHAHTHQLCKLPPIGRFARLHAEILPPSSRNLPQGREQRKCLPRWAERAGVASAGEVLKRDRVYASRLRTPADCPHDSARENREPDPPTGKGLGKPPASPAACNSHEAGDTTYSERVCALCYIKYGAGSGNRTRTASLEGWSSTIELCPLASTTDCIRALAVPRHVVPEASHASHTCVEAEALPLSYACSRYPSIPHRFARMQGSAGYRLNEVPHPQVRFAFGISKWNPPPISCPV